LQIFSIQKIRKLVLKHSSTEKRLNGNTVD
jgi:hypothetical protein